MNDDAHLITLLSRWQDEFQQGHDLDPAALCADRPDLLAELTRRVAAIRAAQLADSATLPPAAPSPLSETATLPPPNGTAPTSEFPRGDIAPPGYQLLGELGRGGMGVVYQARQVKADRLVALKMILSGGHAGADDLARFRTEVEAIARLQHPGIVQVFDVGEHGGCRTSRWSTAPGGRWRRSCLARRCRRRRLPPWSRLWQRPCRRPTKKASSTAT